MEGPGGNGDPVLAAAPAESSRSARSPLRRELARVAAALSFLTVLPVPMKKEMEGCSAYFPLAGWLLGGALYLMWWVTGGLPVLVRGFLVVAAWELLSRGLHADALADTADAFLAGGERDRVLAIMDDSRTGAFGIMALVLLITGKFALVVSLPKDLTGAALVCACVLGRFSLTLLCALFRPAKETGLGSTVIGSTGVRELALAAVLALVPLGVLFRLDALVSAWGLALAVLLGLYSRWKLGGLTGDVVGAGLELTELAALLGFFFL